MDLRLAAFPFRELLIKSNETGSLLKQVMKLGAYIVGGLTNVDSYPRGYLDIIFDLSKKQSKIDLQVDEINDPQCRVLEP